MFRPLDIDDYHKGYLELLGNLTEVGSITEEKFSDQFKKIKAGGVNHQIWVLCDSDNTEIIGSGTILLEEKFIHNCGKVGHIEDIVVSDKHRGKGLGRKIITLLSSIANGQGCYKVILDCAPDFIDFYKKLGFDCKGALMRKDFR